MRDAIALLTISILLVGCAAARPPLPEFTRARESLERAEAAGATADRHAATHLALARSQLWQGERHLWAGDREGARWLLLRAEADADMAELIVREAATRDAARRTLDETSVRSGLRE
jgi:Domain of unknown function (DUF4398)